MDVRALGAADLPALEAFFRRLPEGELTFIKEDVLDPEVVASWARDSRARRRIAADEEGAVAGYLAVIPGLGWSSHVGELRLVVDPARRRQGLGRALARQGLLEAVDAGLHKVFVELVADQQPAVSMFQALGFEGEALLRDHIRDRDGTLRDLLLLSHEVDDTWAGLSATGIADAVR